MDKMNKVTREFDFDMMI